MDERIESFSKRLRELRLNKDYMQKNVAEELGISPNYYSEIERGEKAPSLDLVFKIADFYQVSLSWLFSQETSNNYYINNNKIENGVNGVVNNSYDKQQVVDLYERLLKAKDEVIETLKR